MAAATRNLIGKLLALGAGALAMYYLDPQAGGERRAALRALLVGGRGSDPGARARRLRRHSYHHMPAPDPRRDAELRERIRDRLDRLVSFPRALQVEVTDGVVRLSGNVLAQERDGLLEQLRTMPGVEKLVNAMTAQPGPRQMPDPLPQAPTTAGQGSPGGPGAPA